MEQFMKEGSQMMVKLPAMRQLEAKISAIDSWKDKVADVFHLSSPSDCLVLVRTSYITYCAHANLQLLVHFSHIV